MCGCVLHWYGVVVGVGDVVKDVVDGDVVNVVVDFVVDDVVEVVVEAVVVVLAGGGVKGSQGTCLINMLQKIIARFDN